MDKKKLPINIFSQRGYYYVVLQKNNKNDLSNYRIDRIRNLKISTESFDMKEYDFKLENHINKSLNAYTGNCEVVEIEFHKSILNYIIDELGDDIFITSKNAGEILKATFKTTIDRGLINWLMGLGSKAKILEPKQLVEEILKEVILMKNLYK